MSGDGGDAGGDAEAHVLKLAQLFHHVIDLPSARPLWVEEGLSIIEDKDHLRRGQEGSQRGQILRVLEACADRLGESAEKMSARGGELVATDEPTVGSEPFLDTIVVEDGESDGRFPDSPRADESDWCEIFCEADDLLDQTLASITGPRRWGRQLSKCAKRKHESPYPSVVGSPT